MPRTRQQSAPSNDSISGWDSESELSVLSRSPSPACEEQEQEHIPRPPNRFILYRVHAWKERLAQLERDNAPQTMTSAAFAQYIGPIWRSEPKEVRAFWEAKAKEAKREHKAKYPNYVYRPNRRGGTRPRRKEATPSLTQRTMKTRSMMQQKQAAAVRTGAQERKVNAGGSRKTTTPRGNRPPSKTTTRRVSIDLTADSDDDGDVQVQDRNQNAAVRRPQVSQGAVQPRPGVGGEVSPSTVGPLPVGGGICSPSFDLPVGEGLAPVDHALSAHLQSPNAFDESLVPSTSTSDSEWMEHDRPSLWDSDLPLFPPEILEDDDSDSHYQPEGALRQATFLPDFGSDSSRPMADPFFVGWPPCRGVFLPQGFIAYG
ncbi:hypothetical protein V8D89_011833 [Ganoderma adspersum]